MSSEHIFYEVVNGRNGSSTSPIANSLAKLKPFLIPIAEKSASNERLHEATYSNGIQEKKENGKAEILQPQTSSLSHVKHKRAAHIDLKIGKLPTWNPTHPSYLREGVYNLLGLYVDGVTSDILTFKKGINEYDGRRVHIDHFEKVFTKFFEYMANKLEGSGRAANKNVRKDIINKLTQLMSIVEELKGFRFPSTSLFISFEQEFDSATKNDSSTQDFQLYLVNFEQTEWLGPNSPDLPFISSANEKENPLEPDNNVLFALRHIRYLLRCLWIKRPNTIYLVRHGERYDYTDFNWAPTALHPHDAPLSAAGERQAQDLVDRLKTIQPAIIAVAPMQRAIMCGDPLARTLHSSISVEPGFCEFLCSKTRKKVPGLFSSDVSITPWVDEQYDPVWKKGLRLESWDDVYSRTATTLRGLIERCNGKGDLVAISHRSTLQTMMRAIMGPHWEGETKLEYGGMSMFIQEDEEGTLTDHGPSFLPGKWILHSFNELNFLRDKIQSPSSNPFRHIEGYYEDLEWGNYKSTAELWANKEHKA